MILYHIHRISNNEEYEKGWCIGNTFNTLSNEYNYFFSISAYFNPLTPRSPDLNELIYSLQTNVKEYQLLIREATYENMRLSQFSNLPSRTNCIWLCRENQIDFWKNELGDNIKIFKIEIKDDKIFKSNDKFISRVDDSYVDILDKARKYWSYNCDTEDIQDEYLYTGEFTIIDEIKN